MQQSKDEDSAAHCQKHLSTIGVLMSVMFTVGDSIEVICSLLIVQLHI